MNMIVCRNVLIYFDNKLQNRTMELFNSSLINNGFLVLGDKESIDFTSSKDNFDFFCKKERIYRKKNVL